MFGQMQTAFSVQLSFSDLDFLLPLCLCQLHHASGCAYDIFSEIHCVRDVAGPQHCFPLVFFPSFLTVLPFLFFEVYMFDIFWKDRAYIWVIAMDDYIKGENFKSLAQND